MKYETVIGLETHVELSTETKIFCGCTTQFGGEANTHCCPVCTGQPGTLPVLNKKVVEYAVTAGLALGCHINKVSRMDRKHYTYPDLPKAYQISQYECPLCSNGRVMLSGGHEIRINRIHIEEDAGSLIHESGQILIDYNRCGVPLIEIVTEPDFRSAEEAVEYLEKLQCVLRTVGVSDCRMQEGSLRCDVNISLRPVDTDILGTRTEIKNLNSFTSLSAAVKYEYGRQSAILDGGGKITQETLGFDAKRGVTLNMRGKENADDYRYFPEADIPEIVLTDETIARIRDGMCELPDARIARYTADYGMTEADARLITKYRRVAEYFDEAVRGVRDAKVVARLILTQMFAQITVEADREMWSPTVSAAGLRELVMLYDDGKINGNQLRRLLPVMLERGCAVTEVLNTAETGTFDEAELEIMCKNAIDENNTAVADYRNGKTKALNTLIGAVMRESRGRASADDTRAMLERLIG